MGTMPTRFALFCTTLLLIACTKPLPSRSRANRGTCEATCTTYEFCKGSNNESRHQSCVAECRSIFSEDGKIDESALLNLQRLDCPDLLAFIEGPQKHEIGVAVESPREPSP